MMFFICDQNPKKAVNYLFKNSNKSFCLTQLRELCQLICSTGISSVYKKRPQAMEIQAWILKYPNWTLQFLKSLFTKVKKECNLSEGFVQKINSVLKDLKKYASEVVEREPSYIIFRYNKEYASVNLPNNSRMLLGNAVTEYKKYLSWKGLKSDF